MRRGTPTAANPVCNSAKGFAGSVPVFLLSARKSQNPHCGEQGSDPVRGPTPTFWGSCAAQSTASDFCYKHRLLAVNSLLIYKVHAASVHPSLRTNCATYPETEEVRICEISRLTNCYPQRNYWHSATSRLRSAKNGP